MTPRFLSLIGLLLVASCTPATGPLIDHEAVFARYDWWDNRDWDWYEANIPFIETPSPEIDETYYYRWELLTKHLIYGSPATGYTFTEFIDRPFWSGTYGGIACPLGHQISEVRWLKNDRVLDDFARYWIKTPGAMPRNYSNWYGSALWGAFEVRGGTDWIASMLPLMEEQVEGWMAERFDSTHGLFMWNGMKDGMEENINSRQTERPFDGAFGYRPTLNAYLYGDLRAIARTARVVGDDAKAAAYEQQASALKSRVLQELWDPRRQFFLHQFADDHPSGVRAFTRTYETGPYAGSPHGRELIGYVPWQFNLPDSAHAVAWKYLMDPAYFFAPFGPTVTERNDPQFLIAPRCCVWSGQSWPYATTQTLAAMGNLLNDYEQEVVDAADWFELFQVYTNTHRKDDRPYIAESAHPDTGSWEGSDLTGHSEHYLHSGYVDLVFSGLLGLRPSASDTLVVNPLIPPNWDYFAVDGLRYHGHLIDVVWDRTGARYQRGAGLQVRVAGRTIARRLDMGRLEAVLPPPKPAPSDRRRSNVAVNNGEAWPLVTASFSDPVHPPEFAVDGAYWYHPSPANRWTTAGSPNAADWIRVDFGIEREIEEVKLYFLDDGAGVRPPAEFRIELQQGDGWTRLPESDRGSADPVGHQPTSVRFPPTLAAAVRVTVSPRDGSATGLSELEVWSPTPSEELDVAPGVPNLARGRDWSASDGRDDLAFLSDGLFGMTSYQGARWQPAGDTETDWLAVDLGDVVEIGGADLFLWGDPPRYLPGAPSSVVAPEFVSVSYRVGSTWMQLDNVTWYPINPKVMARNEVRFVPIRARHLRFSFARKGGVPGAVTEISVRGPIPD